MVWLPAFHGFCLPPFVQCLEGCEQDLVLRSKVADSHRTLHKFLNFR